MCKPVWVNIRRYALNHAATLQVNQSFNLLKLGCLMCRYTVKHVVKKEEGTLLIVHADEKWFRGHLALWCPTYGPGGWVDTVKDQESRELVKHFEREREREAINCMAL